MENKDEELIGELAASSALYMKRVYELEQKLEIAVEALDDLQEVIRDYAISEDSIVVAMASDKAWQALEKIKGE